MKTNSMPELKRSLSIYHLVLYGLGVTIGAGIYVLVGATAAKAGIYAPISFLIAAVVMIFTASSFAELAGRFPVSAGEAAYVRAGFNSSSVSLLVGLGVAMAGIVSAATISIGSVGYLREFVPFPENFLIAFVVIVMGGVAVWGILESITLAALFTLVEIAGLGIVIFGGLLGENSVGHQLPEVIPTTLETGVWVGIFGAGLLAFFAFIGFEDLVNVAEEAKNPKVTMPWAIFLTLIISSLLYFLVVSISVLAVPPETLAKSNAPLNLVFEKTTGMSPEIMTLIAVIATLNGVIIQIIMASRVLYGLSKQGLLPEQLAYVHPVARTPLVSTALVVGVILLLALSFPLAGLAAWTSSITLLVFALVNLALVLVKLRDTSPDPEVFQVWLWVPVAGCVISVAFLIVGLV